MGEVWCVTLWEARANLINKYGWAVGNQLILQLVTDGMKLSPANPNFLQARDAILQADLVDNAGREPQRAVGGLCQARHGCSARPRRPVPPPLAFTKRSMCRMICRSVPPPG